MLPFHSILHPTDFSSQASRAFHLACALAQESGARLYLVHVRRPPVPIYGDVGILPPEYVGDREALLEKLARLEPLDTTFSVECRILEGEPAQEILRFAQESFADLIVMGTHGHGGLGRLLLGSVTDVVVRRAGCPVLTVKSPEMTEASKNPFESEMAHA